MELRAGTLGVKGVCPRIDATMLSLVLFLLFAGGPRAIREDFVRTWQEVRGSYMNALLSWVAGQYQL